MSTLERFEDIEGWRKARELVGLVYPLTRRGAFARDFALRDQLLRALISVPGNIAEGFEREGNKEFINFLTIAKASLAEARTYLYLAADQNYITKHEFEQIAGLATDTAKLIGGFIRYLQAAEISGRKFQRFNRSRSTGGTETRNSKLQTQN